MTHRRTTIRQAIVAALTGLPTTGNNVQVGRAVPLQDGSKPPALALYTFPDVATYEPEEGGEIGGRGIPIRLLTVHIEGYYSGGDDEDLDQIAAEVEEAMFADPTFGGLTEWTELGEQDVGRDATGARLEGQITMIYQVAYLIEAGNPQGN